jgi:phytoene dehydrogenase-like protein
MMVNTLFEVDMKTAGPAFSVPVSNEEKKAAERLRKEFEDILKELEKCSRYLLVFFDHTDDFTDDQSLDGLAPLMKRYEKKLKQKFNNFLEALERGLEHYNESFSDTELDNVRDLIIEHVKSVRKGLIAIIDLFARLEDPEFVEAAQKAYQEISSSIERVDFVIREELFDHIDYDILGRIRIGSGEFPLTLRLTRG